MVWRLGAARGAGRRDSWSASCARPRWVSGPRFVAASAVCNRAAPPGWLAHRRKRGRFVCARCPDRRAASTGPRVSSERQREEWTIQSQLAGLRELAVERGLLVTEELVFCDEGFSGATPIRPALERLGDHAAEGAFEVLLCHAPDRLARRYAYQVLRLEEFARAGVEVIFTRGGERSGSPEDELLRQFQGMIGEHERAQIRERTRRGKLHRPPGGDGRRTLRLPVHPQDRDHRWLLGDRRDRGRGRAPDLPPLHRGRLLDRRPHPLGDRAGDPDPQRQGGVGPLDGVGMLRNPPTAARPPTARRKSPTATASRRARPALAASASAAGRCASMSRSSSGCSSRSRRWSTTRRSREPASLKASSAASGARAHPRQRGLPPCAHESRSGYGRAARSLPRSNSRSETKPIPTPNATHDAGTDNPPHQQRKATGTFPAHGNACPRAATGAPPRSCGSGKATSDAGATTSARNRAELTFREGIDHTAQPPGQRERQEGEPVTNIPDRAEQVTTFFGANPNRLYRTVASSVRSTREPIDRQPTPYGSLSCLR